MFTSTLNLIPITSRLAKVSGSRKLKLTVLSANTTKTPKKPFGKEGLFVFRAFRVCVRQSTPPENQHDSSLIA